MTSFTKKQRPSMIQPSSEIDNNGEGKEGSMPSLKQSGPGKRCRVLTKQLSISERKRELTWEKRKRQMHLRNVCDKDDGKDGREGENRMILTDEDLEDLRGSIELGFGFNEDNGGHDLCKTLPALNLYFAVNRQFSDPKMRLSSSPMSSPTAAIYSTPSPRSPYMGEAHQEQGNGSSSPADGWKIFSPGDSPREMKTRLKHWAQAVACSVRQSS